VVDAVAGDKLITDYYLLQAEVRAFRFPELLVEEVTDDGETFMALRCPRCRDLVTGEDELKAVSPAEHWAYAWEPTGDVVFDSQEITFERGDNPDLEETLYYQHNDDHAVSLPDGWTENWD
jgi:uncharacterized C2H2 Zn-finger protein